MNDSSQNKQTKTSSRLLAVQILYASEISGIGINLTDLDSTLESAIQISEDDQLRETVNAGFFKTLIGFTLRNFNQIDDQITQAMSRTKTVGRLESLILALLRTGTCELLYCATPHKVVVNEYTNLANKFFDDKEVAFVNAVLDRIARTKHNLL